jgi:nitrate/nitrite-specific signal transduction histidine kinase
MLIGILLLLTYLESCMKYSFLNDITYKIESYDNSCVKEVFYELVQSQSEVTKAFIIAFASEAIYQTFKDHKEYTHLFLTGKKNEAKEKLVKDVINDYINKIDDLILFIEVETNKKSNSIWVKNNFLRNLSIKLYLAPILKLNAETIIKLRKEDRETYLKVGDAIFLAGLYLQVN